MTDEQRAELKELVRIEAIRGNPANFSEDEIAFRRLLSKAAPWLLEAAQENERWRWLGDITPCPNCDGSGKNSHGSCCRIPGHARDCACAVCQWKNAMYRQEAEIAALKARIAELDQIRLLSYELVEGSFEDGDEMQRLKATVERLRLKFCATGATEQDAPCSCAACKLAKGNA